MRRVFSKKFFCILLVVIMSTSITMHSFAYTNDELVYPRPNLSTCITSPWTLDTTTKLFYSNAPEQITYYPGGYPGGILYKDTRANGTGKFRVFWSHINSTGGNMYIGMAIINTSQLTVKINYTNGAYDANGRNGGDSDKAVLGQQLLSKFLSSGSSEKTLATLAPGQKTYVGFYTYNGKTSLGMYDIVVRNASNNSLVTNGITVLTYISRYADPANVIDNDYVIPRNGDTRGLFDYANRSITISGTNRQLSLGKTENDLNPKVKYPSNEAVVGTSQISGDPSQVKLYGAYAIISNITINPGTRSAIILSPDWQQTSYDHYLAAYVQGRGVVTKNVPYYHGWVLKANQSSSITIKTSLPAYEWAPLHIAVVPEP